MTPRPMTRRQLRPALVLSAWTLLVWTTRINNIWTDESLSVSGQLWRTALAVSFTLLAVATIVVWARSRSSSGEPPAWAPHLVRGFVLWTAAVWVVRAVQIAFADHDAAFIAVHTALAVVSVSLAVWADRGVGRRLPGREPVAAQHT